MFEVIVVGPLLTTKLHVPTRRPDALVPRRRLADRLPQRTGSRLTLVSAPAGFGKTTLLTEGLSPPKAGQQSLAWLSLDERDSEPAVFWSYVIAALRTAAPGVGADALALLDSPQPSLEAVLASVLNDLDALPAGIVLVLDDYHLIDSRAVQDEMARFVDRLPAQLHLVIASRSDPPLPLARLRGRGELVEIRAADLRFTSDEAAAYLNDVMALALTAADVATLEGRTEGWIAALHLAGLSMRGRDDVAGFIADFAGGDRYIVDYLVEEVLHRQSGPVRDFLLTTSILDRLTGPLCDAVTGHQGGGRQLEALDRANLFLVALDDRRRWYRYHHLFADVLRARLDDERGDAVAALHRRASGWFDRNGQPAEAIRHALAGNDFARAAALVERQIPGMLRNRQEAVLRRWVESLPEEVVRARPVLSEGLAGALLASGAVEGVAERLQDAEAGLDPGGPTTGSDVPPVVVVDREAYRRLPAAIEVHRAGLALALGDERGTARHVHRALELAQHDDHLNRASAAALLGLTSWAAGHLEEAHRAYAECLAGLARAGYVADTLGCAVVLADIRLVQGRLGEAGRTYEQALQRATGPDGPVLRGTADLYVGSSGIRREHNDLAGATQDLLRSQALGEHAGLPQHPYRWRVAMAWIRHAEGDPSGALDLLDDAERLYVPDFLPNVRPVPAQTARMRVAAGDWGAALGWAHASGLSVADELSYRREYEHLTLARVLLAQHTATRREDSFRDANRLLARLLVAATDGARTASVIEVLVLQSLLQHLDRNDHAAQATLQSALELAEPEGYVRIFVDEGPPMALLLRAAAKQGGGYPRRLLAAAGPTDRDPPNPHGLVEPLSPRELDVLRLLGTDLTGPDIARQLVVSLSTLRTHSNHVYAKLGVNHRRAAVRRGRELGLLSPTHDR